MLCSEDVNGGGEHERSRLRSATNNGEEKRELFCGPCARACDFHFCLVHRDPDTKTAGLFIFCASILFAPSSHVDHRFSPLPARNGEKRTWFWGVGKAVSI